MSPIRPENRDRYPADWPEIAAAAKERAGWRCECEGECGRGTHEGRCPNVHGQPAYGTGSRVVLTTAHLDHVPENCAPENLRVMCQGCHLHYDREHHAVTRAETARRAMEGAGQMGLQITVHETITVGAPVMAVRCPRCGGRGEVQAYLARGGTAPDCCPTCGGTGILAGRWP